MPIQPRSDLSREGAGAERPAGLDYIADFLGTDVQAEIAAFLLGQPRDRWSRQTMMNNPSRRRMLCFGYNYYNYYYNYETSSRSLTVAEPLPPILIALREKAAAAAGLDARSFVQAIANDYATGAGFTGAHVDALVFWPDILGVSLLGPAEMRLRNPATHTGKAGKPPIGYRLRLDPGSLLMLRGPARGLAPRAGARPIASALGDVAVTRRCDGPVIVASAISRAQPKPFPWWRRIPDTAARDDSARRALTNPR